MKISSYRISLITVFNLDGFHTKSWEIAFDTINIYYFFIYGILYPFHYITWIAKDTNHIINNGCKNIVGVTLANDAKYNAFSVI